jgi:4-diphosphocytidyl-2-C-methyl-D-erythritol kinase
MSRVRSAREDELSIVMQIESAASVLFSGWVAAELTADNVPLSVLDEAQRAGRLFVAIDERDQPIGFAVVELLDDEPHLEELDVLPEHGKQGHGSRLIEAVCSWAKAAGYDSVTLSTYVDVPWNAPFYRRRGFSDLPAAGQTAGLKRVLDSERAKGFPMERRILMRREL